MILQIELWKFTLKNRKPFVLFAVKNFKKSRWSGYKSIFDLEKEKKKEHGKLKYKIIKSKSSRGEINATYLTGLGKWMKEQVSWKQKGYKIINIAESNQKQEVVESYDCSHHERSWCECLYEGIRWLTPNSDSLFQAWTQS